VKPSTILPARAVLERLMPGFAASAMDGQFRDGLLSSLIARVPWLESQKARNRLRGELADSGGNRW
jgi:hypothetical protein